jgi:WD40 repeat protein
MITAETEVRNGQIYLWNLLNGSRVATMCPFDGYVVSVGFSPSESQIVTVGTDSKGRHKIIIWQIATLLQAHVTLSGSIDHPSIVARQLSDFSISKVIFDPISETALVTCGRENIRLWRTKKQHLSGRPILLNEYCRGFIYHDLALVRDATNGSFLFAASNKGMVLKICYQTEQVLSAFQLHSESVNTFQVFSGYAVTGGDDCRLRIWPMDFGDFLLEARHEGGVKVVNGGRQGRKLVIGTKAGTLGLLDVTQHR